MEIYDVINSDLVLPHVFRQSLKTDKIRKRGLIMTSCDVTSKEQCNFMLTFLGLSVGVCFAVCPSKNEPHPHQI